MSQTKRIPLALTFMIAFVGIHNVQANPTMGEATKAQAQQMQQQREQ